MARKTKCYSVRLESFTEISPKAAKLRGFDGSEDIFPQSQIFGRDYDVTKSEAYWIAAWILEKKNLQYSNKKQAWFDRDTMQMLPTKTIRVHKPDHVEPVEPKADESLTR